MRMYAIVLFSFIVQAHSQENGAIDFSSAWNFKAKLADKLVDQFVDKAQEEDAREITPFRRLLNRDCLHDNLDNLYKIFLIS